MSDDLAELLEILVHSAAPTSKKEDDRIRAQALACLEFKPEKRTHISNITFARKRVRRDEGETSSPGELWGSQAGGNSEERDQEKETRKRRCQLKVSQDAESIPESSGRVSGHSVECITCFNTRNS